MGSTWETTCDGIAPCDEKWHAGGDACLLVQNYCGKTLDNFDYAFSSLLMAHGVDVRALPSLDCLSFRSFAFAGGDAAAEWFRPLAPWRFYLTRLADTLGCKDVLAVWPAQAVSPGSLPADRWTLVGEAGSLGLEENIQSRLYQGAPPFFLCRPAAERGGFLICNPLGAPCTIYGAKALEAALHCGDGFAVTFTSPPVVRIPAPRSVLDEALAWRKTCGQGGAAGSFPFEAHYGGSRQEQLALRYGTMNFQLQMDKTIRYFFHAGLLERPVLAELGTMLQELPEFWRECCFDLIRRLDRTLWNALGEEG